MILKKEWAGRFLQACVKVYPARRRSLISGQSVDSTLTDGRCWVVAAGYAHFVK